MCKWVIWLVLAIGAYAFMEAEDVADYAAVNSTESTHSMVKRSAFFGTATWYDVETWEAGACGQWIDNSMHIVALNEPMYGDLNSVSDWCGRHIMIANGLKTARAVIMDACPETKQCHYGALDMSMSLFQEFHDLTLGVFPIAWWTIDDSSDNDDDDGGGGSNNSNDNNNNDNDNEDSGNTRNDGGNNNNGSNGGKNGGDSSSQSRQTSRPSPSSQQASKNVKTRSQQPTSHSTTADSNAKSSAAAAASASSASAVSRASSLASQQSASRASKAKSSSSSSSSSSPGSRSSSASTTGATTSTTSSSSVPASSLAPGLGTGGDSSSEDLQSGNLQNFVMVLNGLSMLVHAAAQR